MRRNLVEQQNRSTTLPFGDEIGMRQHHTNQQRLLLSCRTGGCSYALVEMGDHQVLTMRSRKRPACCRITVAPRDKIMGKVTRRIETVQCQRRTGKEARRFTGKSAAKAFNDFRSPGRDGTTMPHHGQLKRCQPIRVSMFAGQQPVSLPHRCFVTAGVARVGRVERKHETVKKPAASPCAFGKQTVLRRGQPDERNPVA